MKIVVQPSGHTFEVQPGESILDEALRAGVALDYGCQTGNCGDCVARLIKGDIKAIGHADYPLSEAARARGDFLSCRFTALSDLLIEAREFQHRGQIPVQQRRAKLGRSKAYGDSVLGLNLRLSRSQPLHFLPGQAVDLQFEGLPRRRFAIASCPCNGSQLELHVPHRDNDALSEYLFEQARTGTAVELQGPFGGIDFDEDCPLDHLFVVYGTGFAPAKAIIEHIFARERDYRIDLLWFARHHRHYLSNHCRMWADVMDDFHFQAPVIGDQSLALPDESSLCAQLDSELNHFDPSHPRRVYLIAPPDWISALSARLRSHFGASEVFCMNETIACV